MNLQLRERALGYLRAYWQQMVYALLGVVLVFQIGGNFYRLLELRQVDHLIAQTNDDGPKSEEGKEGDAPPQSPQMGMGGPGGPPGDGQQRRPEKDIFRKEEQKFMLTAIYLNKAVINGQEVAVGGRIGKATLESIASFSVTIQIEGEDNTRTLDMFTGQNGGSMGNPNNNRPSRGSSRSQRPGPGMSSPPPMPVMAPGGPGGGGREAFRNMSPEQRRQMMEQMPPQVRERMMRRMGGG